jgi:uncharacterized protein YdaL
MDTMETGKANDQAIAAKKRYTREGFTKWFFESHTIFFYSIYVLFNGFWGIQL